MDSYILTDLWIALNFVLLSKIPKYFSVFKRMENRENVIYHSGPTKQELILYFFLCPWKLKIKIFKRTKWIELSEIIFDFLISFCVRTHSFY